MNRNKLTGIILFSVFLAFLTENPAVSQVIPVISADEFTRISDSFSETGGNFSNDNWVSNETSYLEVLDKFIELDIHGGAYIGVGPNQNFTYIANIKPHIAFIVDIRRQNMLQHLIYKVLFEMADTRAEFFSILFSKPLNPNSGIDEDSNISRMIYYFYRAPSDPGMFKDNLAKIENVLTEKYKYPLTDVDFSSLDRIFRTFFRLNLEITYNGNAYSWFPTYAQFLQIGDRNNNQRNPFNSREDFLFLKKMHAENRIIPVTGNFGGGKALKAVADYLQENHLKVTAFYVSNVEQYLLRDWNLWLKWGENVKYLPISSKTVFIRWTYQRSYWDDNSFGPRNTTRLQWMIDFIKNFNNNRYSSYSDLILIDYIK